jgi:leucyl aminopeptidase (aminopeptidase T)
MFDRLMAQLRGMLDKIKNFKGSVPGERGVPESTGYEKLISRNGEDMDEAYSMDDVRKDAEVHLKKSIDAQSDARIAKARNKDEEPFMAKVGRKIVGGVKGGVKGAWKGFTESAPPNFPEDLEKKLKAEYKDNPEKAYATMWMIHNRKKNESVLPETSANEYWCQIDKQAKPIPEGYKKLASGYITRK